MSNPFENLTDPSKNTPGAKPGVPGQPADADRRQAVRRTLRANAMVMLPGQPGRVGRTMDVSETGLCVILPEAIASQTECMVGFEMPDKNGNRQRLQSKARVVHSILDGRGGGFKVGMQLLAPPAEVVKALQTYVRGE